MYALMTLAPRGDSILQVGTSTAQWLNVYTPVTWVCEETLFKCWENLYGFDANLCWVAKFDESRYIIPQSVLDYFGNRGRICG